MQPPRHLDTSLLKQAPPLKPYLDSYLSHNSQEMQKDNAALGSYSNFPLSRFSAALPLYETPTAPISPSSSPVCKHASKLFLLLLVQLIMHCFWSLTSPSVSSGLNSNLNVPLELGGSSGGALSYKEPPQSKLKKLWATTDPLEQNSKPGKQNVIFETFNRRCDHVTTTMFWLQQWLLLE